jgi:uncharacterized protein DUF4190
MMASVGKICFECGMPIAVGIANCAHCGAKVGTLFDETAAPAAVSNQKRWAKAPKHMDENQKIEKAQDRANSSVVLGLTSFVPLFGLALGIAAVVYGTMSVRALKTHNIEDGRGSATAGFVIGSLGIIAQACLIIYAMKLVSVGKS